MQICNSIVGLLILFVVLLTIACNAQEDVIVCQYGLDPNTQKCMGPGGPDVGPLDSGSTSDTISNSDTVGEDVGEPRYECVDGVDSQHLKIGQPCTSHGQCNSCYCYNEAYLSPFRFCTQPCGSGVGSACPAGTGEFDEFTCLGFAMKNIQDHGLKVEDICMPVCEDVEDCALYAPNYNVCTKFDTKWDGKTISARSTCSIQ